MTESTLFSNQDRGENLSESEKIAKIAKVVKGIRIAMLTTSEDGKLCSRPMACQDVDFEGTLWFMTKNPSGKVQAIAEDQHVNVSYADPEHQRYASIVGRARLVNDIEKIRELWNPLLKAWFTEGVNDPEIILIAVDVESAEIWDAPNGKLLELVGLAKAALTGRAYDWNKHHQHLSLNAH